MEIIQKVAAWILSLMEGIKSRLRNVGFRVLGVRIDGYVWLRRISIPRQWSSISMGAGSALDEGVTLIASGEPRHHKIVIGTRTYINRGTILDASQSLSIGEDCLIGPYCFITDHDHQIVPGQPPGSLPLVAKPTRLGDRVWLGAHVTVLKGVKIGDDAVVGAGAVVTCDVPSKTIVVGIPAQPLTKGH